MALRSKIDVEVEAKQLQASVVAISKFARAAEKSDSLWDKYGAKAYEAERTARKISDLFKAQNVSLSQGVNLQEQFSKAAGHALTTFGKLASVTKSVATNLTRISLSFINISTVFGIVGGLAAAGVGLFGTDALASMVSARRKAAMRLGAGYGAASAFELNFSRYGDASGMLSAASEGIYNVTSPSYLALLNAHATRGLSINSPTESMLNVLENLPRIFANVPDGMIGPTAEALHLTDVMSLKSIIAYLHASPDERIRQINNARADSDTLNISADAQEKWANFKTALSNAKLEIETIIGDKLSALVDPLDHLSASAVNLVASFSNSKLVKDGLDKTGTGLKWLIDTLQSDSAKSDFKSFLEGMKALVPVMHTTLDAAGIAAKAALSLVDPNSGADRYKTWGNYFQWLLDPQNPTSTPMPSGSQSMIDGVYIGGGHPRSLRWGNFGGPINRNDPVTYPHNTSTSSQSAGLSPIEADNITGITTRLQRVYPQMTTQECVELAFRMSGIPYTSDNVLSVTRGPSANDPNIPAGTPVSTFFNADRSVGEHYAAGGTGTPGIRRDHMGVKLPDDGSGNLILLNQWRGQSPTATTYVSGNQPGTERDANAYYAIMDSMGLPAGTYENNPFRRQVLAGIASNRFAGGAMGVDAYQQRQRAIERRTKLEGRSAFLDTLQTAKQPKANIVIDNSQGSVHISHDRTAYG